MPDKPDPSLSQLTQSTNAEWTPIKDPVVPGVWIKSLRHDPIQMRSPTIMLKFEPGAKYPAHVHPAGEEIFVLEGSVKVGKDFLVTGDYLFTAPNNAHSVFSGEGCMLFLNVPEEVVIIEEFH